VKHTLFVFLLASLPFSQPSAFSQTSDTDPKQSMRTVRDLAKQGQDSLPKLAPYVTDQDLGVRIEAVKALIQIGGPKTLDMLVQAAGDNDPEIQIRATDGLVNVYLPGFVKSGISGSLHRVGNSVAAKFTDTDDQIIDAYVMVRPDVIMVLGKLARGGASLESRANAARAVGILRGRAAIPDLIEALHSKDDRLMYESLIALQKIRDPSVAPRIGFVVHDLNDRIQITALETVGLLRDRGAGGDVRDVMDHARNIKIRRAALEALADIADPMDRAVFTRYLNDKDESLRASAAEGLGRLHMPEDRAAVEKAFTDEHSMSPRLAGAFAVVDLGNLDTSQFSALRYLVNALNQRVYRGVAVAYLTELTRTEAVRQAIYPLLSNATKDEKIQMSIVLSLSGNKDSLPYLQTISMDSDSEVAEQGLRGLKTLRARLP